MKTKSSPSLYRKVIERLSTVAVSTLVPALKVRSTTLPDSTFFSVVRTNAPPLPGLTCWNSTTVHSWPSRLSTRPFLRSFVVAMLGSAPQGSDFLARRQSGTASHCTGCAGGALTSGRPSSAAGAAGGTPRGAGLGHYPAVLQTGGGDEAHGQLAGRTGRPGQHGLPAGRQPPLQVDHPAGSP